MCEPFQNPPYRHFLRKGTLLFPVNSQNHCEAEAGGSTAEVYRKQSGVLESLSESKLRIVNPLTRGRKHGGSMAEANPTLEAISGPRIEAGHAQQP